MKYDVIHLNGEQYAVDKEAQIDQKDLFISQNSIYIFGELDKHGIPSDSVKIVASSDKSLGLPLLPPIEEDVIELAEKTYPEATDGNPHLISEHNKGQNTRRVAFVRGYKAASQKKYSEEDMWKIYVAGFQANEEKKKPLDDFKTSLQSLSPKPIQVELEMEYEFDTGLEPAYGDLIPKVNEDNFVTVLKWIF